MRMVAFRTTLRRMARLVRDLSRESGKPGAAACSRARRSSSTSTSSRASPTRSSTWCATPSTTAIEADPQRARPAPASRATATVRISAAPHRRPDRHRGRGRRPRHRRGGRARRKARELGIVGPDETPSPEAVAQLIFAPGFSTARTVTGVSGRGVGMDVVKRTAEALLGSVAVTQHARRRARRSRLTLPLTLAIIDGMVVRVGERALHHPGAVDRPQPAASTEEDVTGVLGQAEMLATPQGLVPLVRLRATCSRTDGDGGAGVATRSTRDDARAPSSPRPTGRRSPAWSCRSCSASSRSS